MNQFIKVSSQVLLLQKSSPHFTSSKNYDRPICYLHQLQKITDFLLVKRPFSLSKTQLLLQQVESINQTVCHIYIKPIQQPAERSLGSQYIMVAQPGYSGCCAQDIWPPLATAHVINSWTAREGCPASGWLEGQDSDIPLICHYPQRDSTFSELSASW